MEGQTSAWMIAPPSLLDIGSEEVVVVSAFCGGG